MVKMEANTTLATEFEEYNDGCAVTMFGKINIKPKEMETYSG